MVHLSPRPALGEVKRSKQYLAGCGACTQGVRAYHSASKGAVETKSAWLSLIMLNNRQKNSGIFFLIFEGGWVGGTDLNYGSE